MVTYSEENRIATITLNRPEKRNAMNPQLVSQLTAAFQRAGADDAVKVVILRGNGEAFSAGADLAYLQTLQTASFEENVTDSRNLSLLFKTISQLPKVVIAQIEGHAIAGGCGLATVCDISFSVPEAKFGYTEVKLGFVPAIVASFVVKKLGTARANELLLKGDLISATEAQSVGLINFVVDRPEIGLRVDNYARELCEGASGNSLMVTKGLLNKLSFGDLDNQMENAALLNAEVRSSADFKKGIGSFLNKEQIEW